MTHWSYKMDNKSDNTVDRGSARLLDQVNRQKALVDPAACNVYLVTNEVAWQPHFIALSSVMLVFHFSANRLVYASLSGSMADSTWSAAL